MQLDLDKKEKILFQYTRSNANNPWIWDPFDPNLDILDPRSKTSFQFAAGIAICGKIARIIPTRMNVPPDKYSYVKRKHGKFPLFPHSWRLTISLTNVHAPGIFPELIEL